MRLEITTTRVGAIFMVLLMIGAAFAMVPASVSALSDTDITYDDTEGDLAGDGDDVIEDFNASSEESTELAAEIDTSTTTGNLDEVTLNVTMAHDDGEETIEYAEITASGDDIEDDTADWVTTDHEGAVLNLSHDELEKVPMEAEENVTVTFNVEFETDDDDDDLATDDFEVEIQNTEDRTVMHLHEDADDFGAVDTDEQDAALWQVFTDDDDVMDEHTIEDEVGIAGDDTTITIFIDESDVSDDFADAADHADDEDLLVTMTFTETDDYQPFMVFLNDPDDDLVDEDDDTYAVYDDSDDVLVIHLGEDDWDDEEEIELLAANHHPGALDDIGFTDLRDADFGHAPIAAAFGIMGPFGVLAVLGFVIIPRRRDAAEQIEAERPETPETLPAPGADGSETEPIEAT